MSGREAEVDLTHLPNTQEGQHREILSHGGGDLRLKLISSTQNHVSKLVDLGPGPQDSCCEYGELLERR